MSQSEIDRFKRDLKTDPALAKGAGKLLTLAEMVRFAASKGYSFTVEEAQAQAQAKAKAAGRKLDAERDDVAEPAEADEPRRHRSRPGRSWPRLPENRRGGRMPPRRGCRGRAPAMPEVPVQSNL